MAKGVRERRPRALELFKIGRALAAEGQVERAIESYVAALSIDPDFSEALVNLGILYGQMGPAQAAEALRCLERAVDLAPRSARAHYNLGVALSRGRLDVDRAISEFEATVAIEPRHRNALYALALQWNRKGDLVQASAYHRRYQAAMGSALTAPQRADTPARGQGPAPTPRARRPAEAPSAPRSRERSAERFLRVRFVRG